MAQIYPNKIPIEVLKDPFRKSEINFFKILESLDNNYYVFYSVAYQLKGRYNFVSDGEIDFLIFHPNKGFLVIELKGGKIDYDNLSQMWFSTNRFGDKNQIKNPFEQAKTNHYSLRTKLQQGQLTTNINYRTCYAVIFPDCNMQNENIGFSYANEIFLDKKQIHSNTIQKEFDEIFHYWHPSHLKYFYDETPVVKTFAHLWKFESPLLEHIENVRNQQLELTQQQYLLIDFLNRQRQAKICGCAGSGKTFIAAEKARRLKMEGFNPVFLCWSKSMFGNFVLPSVQTLLKIR
ncbi:nuclease-related domain-containing protein [Haliscomenobacter hydrossis]|uniref:nuclease-related domain-containing protein n=1 Tax=Haliscomenobacter hydrossis TaxID=2350 RepID=UPI00031B4621|nr:nuclease-related domain-containing protein [Haliscomenobacter hydrossis]